MPWARSDRAHPRSGRSGEPAAVARRRRGGAAPPSRRRPRGRARASTARSRWWRRTASACAWPGASTARCATSWPRTRAGPALVVAERIDDIQRALPRKGWARQFHPTYTRMVPAHHVTTLRLVGCPDPSPVHRRFFDPPRGVLPADLDVIGERYVARALPEVPALARGGRTPREPIGVAFSGGIDSGAVLLCALPRAARAGPEPGAAQGVHARRGRRRARTRGRPASSCAGRTSSSSARRSRPAPET